MFDAARKAIKTPLPFASDISQAARASAIESSLELIEQGYHREAMFWIAVTHSRCQKVLSLDGQTDLSESFRRDSYQELVSDLGVPTFSKIRERCADIKRRLPQLWDLAERIIATNREIKDD